VAFRDKAAERRNGCDVLEGSLWFCLYTYSGGGLFGGGGRRNVNYEKIKDEMTKRQTVWLVNVN